ncbi:MAG TPA: glycosyltransferase [Solirubrobacteraceae bacterium]|nr:glycosyltransferase [Solirubrobacteraceae bacterium]
MALSTLRGAAARVSAGSSRPLPTACRVPLSALRSLLDEQSAGSSWLLHPDGVLGRALLLPSGGTFTVPLRLSGEALFLGQAMLLPHDWRDLRDAVRASVAITDGAGHERVLWSGTLRPGDLGKPRGRRVECRLPASTTSLRLRIQGPGAPEDTSVKRAIWLEPAIIDLDAPLAARPSSRPESIVAAARRSVTPLISVLTPVHDPPLQMLEEAIASIREQTFPDWELCLVDDGSSDAEVIAVLERHASSDPRIRYKRRETAGGISAATNTALELATGEYVALMDHDDMLTPDALRQVADRLTAAPDLDMVYSDEDVIGEGGFVEPHPKPGWSPEHMSALMYTCHLGVYRRSLAVDLGGFRSQFDGCQDYDFVLRLMERTDRIAHIPRVLYHWRAHATSTAGGEAKPWAYLAQPGAIAEHLRRSGVDAEVQFAQLPGIHRIVYRVPPSTSVDLVLGVDDVQGLAQAASSWLAQAHPSWGVVLAAPPDSLESATAAVASAGVTESRISTVQTGTGDDRVTALARAADAATAEHLIVMQAPAAGLTHDWLTRLIGYSGQPQIAAAGPVVLAPDGRIQQAGIAIPEGIPLYVQHGSPAAGAPLAVYNLSAVSGVLATRRSTYHKLGGLDPQFGELALIEYCLRATETNMRVVIVPDARLRATGPDLTNNDLPAIWRLRERWARAHAGDRHYNPNYRTDRGDFVLVDYG